MSKLVLVSDFNINVLAPHPPPLSSHLQSISNILGLHQIINSPTHFSPGNHSAVDLVFIPPNSQYDFFIFPPIESSDQQSILFSFTPPVKPFSTSPRTLRKKKVWLYTKQTSTPLMRNFSLQTGKLYSPQTLIPPGPTSIINF